MSTGSPTRETRVSYANQRTVKTWPWALLIKVTSFAREQEVMQPTHSCNEPFPETPSLFPKLRGRGEGAGCSGEGEGKRLEQNHVRRRRGRAGRGPTLENILTTEFWPGAQESWGGRVWWL